jgi:hypothetical protein
MCNVMVLVCNTFQTCVAHRVVILVSFVEALILKCSMLSSSV